MNSDGSAQMRLTSNPASDGLPAWSPDGARIAFNSDRDDPSVEIYVMNSNGTGVTRLTSAVFTQDVVPRWSPDGSRILWRKDSGGCGSADIWVMSVTGADQAVVVCSPLHDSEGGFSPDGTKIVFSSYRDGDPEIYIQNADGSGVIRLTFSPGQDSDVDWGRLGAFHSGPPTGVDQCKNGGWARFDNPRRFKNQGDCIQFVNTRR